MTNTIRILTLFALTVFIHLNHDAWAQEDLSPNYAIGARVGYLALANSTLYDADISFNPVPLYGINMSYFVNERLAIELSGETTKTDMELKVDSESMDFGELTQYSVLLSLVFRSETNVKNLIIYAGGGAGYYFNDIDEKGKKGNGIDDFFPSNRRIKGVENSIGVQGNVGLEYFFKKNYSFIFDIRFLFSEAEVEIEFPDSTTDKTDLPLNAMILGTGIKVHF